MCGQWEQALPWNRTGTRDKCCRLSGNADVPVDTVHRVDCHFTGVRGVVAGILITGFW